MEIHKDCQVCGRKNGFMHFGAFTCKACAAFFRRTMTLELKFWCTCHDRNPYKLGCKACRLKRCFEAGMKRELVRAVSLRPYHMKRQKEMLEKEKLANLQKNSLFLFNGENSSNAEFLKNLMELGERSYQVWFSTAPLPANQLDKTLVELLYSHDNILARNEQLTNICVPNFNKCEFLRNIEKNGMTMEWHERPGRSSTVRSTLICISLLMALPAFQSLDLQDQGTAETASLLMLALRSLEQSKEVMMFPTGIASIELIMALIKFHDKMTMAPLVRKLFVTPMKLYAKVDLDRLESTLLIYILLCLPAASTGLSKEAQQILLEESEKFGKMLLQLQQYRFGEQAGALRYMESQQLIWSAVEGKFIFQKILQLVYNVVNKGISRTFPKIYYELFEHLKIHLCTNF